ncbi:MAG: hypothetical protein J0I41_14150 [Filimonas sp.]|nr:hypothetical protein [Filimonas sp.]
MNHSNLVQLIENFAARSQSRETFDLMKTFQSLSADQFKRNEALKLLQEGIDIYQQTDDYSKAIGKIDLSLRLFPSASGYFNRGVINWCEHKYYECFKDQCATLIFSADEYPLSYFYLAHSLYNVAGDTEKTSLKAEQIILDFIIENLKEGQRRGDENAHKMIHHVIQHRDELI